MANVNDRLYGAIMDKISDTIGNPPKTIDFKVLRQYCDNVFESCFNTLGELEFENWHGARPRQSVYDEIIDAVELGGQPFKEFAPYWDDPLITRCSARHFEDHICFDSFKVEDGQTATLACVYVPNSAEFDKNVYFIRVVTNKYESNDFLDATFIRVFEGGKTVADPITLKFEVGNDHYVKFYDFSDFDDLRYSTPDLNAEFDKTGVRANFNTRYKSEIGRFDPSGRLSGDLYRYRYEDDGEDIIQSWNYENAYKGGWFSPIIDEDRAIHYGHVGTAEESFREIVHKDGARYMKESDWAIGDRVFARKITKYDLPYLDVTKTTTYDFSGVKICVVQETTFTGDPTEVVIIDSKNGRTKTYRNAHVERDTDKVLCFQLLKNGENPGESEVLAEFDFSEEYQHHSKMSKTFFNFSHVEQFYDFPKTEVEPFLDTLERLRTGFARGFARNHIQDGTF